MQCWADRLSFVLHAHEYVYAYTSYNLMPSTWKVQSDVDKIMKHGRDDTMAVFCLSR